MLKILLDLCLNASHKGGGFSKVLSEKSFEFLSSRKNSTVTFNMGFVLLLVEVDFIPEK